MQNLKCKFAVYTVLVCSIEKGSLTKNAIVVLSPLSPNLPTYPRGSLHIVRGLDKACVGMPRISD